jgi:hypothetical protein
MTYTAEQKLLAVERMARNVEEAILLMPSVLAERGRAHLSVLNAIADDYRGQIAASKEAFNLAMEKKQ